MNDVQEQIGVFCATLQEFHEAAYASSPEAKPRIDTMPGSKFTRVTVETWKSKSVYCFIDNSNGDILKAAGWKAPAKGARGNIFNDNCDVGTRADLYGSGLYRR